MTPHHTFPRPVLAGCCLAVLWLLAWAVSGSMALSAGGCAASPPGAARGDLHRPVTTASAAAQQHFDTGLLWCYAFNHDEAVRCFERALDADPDCAMAHWGVAWALGPNINLPLGDAAVAARARAAAERALQLRDGCTPVERRLIEAMAARYGAGPLAAAAAADPIADRDAQDRAFAAAMRAVFREFPDDADVGAILADALLNLAPWDQWTSAGAPKAGTAEILEVLERVLAFAPDNILANHLYIHATEASPTPELAAASAARLGGLAPGCGHLVHMPAHTWQRMGRYREAIECNLAAADLDREYFRMAGPQGFYHGYMAHNQHFAAYAAMYAGDFATALRAARELVADMPQHLLDAEPLLLDGFRGVPLHVLIRFGKWREVLAEPMPEDRFPITVAMAHYARGVAQANLRDIDGAARSQELFEAAVQRVPDDALVGATNALEVLGVARHVLAGELAWFDGRREAAFAALRQGVAAEDALRYDEPSGWMMPVRHALGALLLEDGQVAAAEQVYREDLRRHRDNGWALHGLAQCLRRRGAPEAEAVAVEAAFRRAWAAADTELHASCFCASR